MTAAPDSYQLYAIRYATRPARRSEHFIGGDPHDGPMPMDYFVWAAVGAERTFVIDSGFTAEVGARRGRQFLRCPVDTLGLIGVRAEDVQDVILTHLHYDHVGNFHRFPNARFHLQERELGYATGRHMRHAHLAHAYEVEDVVGIVRLNFGRRVALHDGERELAPGLSIHLAGGHTAGIQYVRVHTRRGWVVLASDVSHFYANMETGRPFPIAFHVGDMLDGFGRLRAHAPDPAHIVPGHDPLVMRRYPAARPDLDGIIVRLDAAPNAEG